MRNATSAASSWRPRSSSPSRTLRRSALRRRRSRRRRPSIHSPTLLTYEGVSGRSTASVPRSSRSTSSSRSAPDARCTSRSALRTSSAWKRPKTGRAHLEQRARAPERDAQVVHGLVVGRGEQARDRLAKPRVEVAELRRRGTAPAMPRSMRRRRTWILAHRCTRTRLAVGDGLEAERARQRAAHGEPRGLGDSLVVHATVGRRRRPEQLLERRARLLARRLEEVARRRSRRSRRASRPRSRRPAAPARRPGRRRATTPCDASAERSAITWLGSARPRHDVHAPRPWPRPVLRSPWSSSGRDVSVLEDRDARGPRARARAPRGARGGGASRGPGRTRAASRARSCAAAPARCAWPLTWTRAVRPPRPQLDAAPQEVVHHADHRAARCPG